MKAVVVIAATFLMVGSSAHPTYIELSGGPSYLNGTRVEYVLPCNEFSCYVMAKGNKKYIAVVNSRRETRRVYEIAGTEKKPIFKLRWAPDKYKNWI